MTLVNNAFEKRSPLPDVRGEGLKNSDTPAASDTALNANAEATVKPVVSPPKPAPLSQDVVRKQLEAAVARLKEYADGQQRELNFSIDEGSEQLVIKVFNANTGELVRQIPNEEALKLAEQFSVPDSGALFDSIV